MKLKRILAFILTLSTLLIMTACGADGVSVISIEKTDTNGLVDTYTVSYSDGTTSTFQVTNGSDGAAGATGAAGAAGADGVSITEVKKTATDGLVDTYTIFYSDETSTTFQITNGKNGEDGEKGEDGAPGEGSVCTSYYLACQNGYTGTQEEWVMDILLEVDATLTQSGQAADAKVVGDTMAELLEVADSCFEPAPTYSDRYIVLSSMYGYMEVNGTIYRQENNNYSYSNKVPVEPGDEISLTVAADRDRVLSMRFVTLFNSRGEALPTLGSSIGSGVTTFTIPDGAAYAVVTFATSEVANGPELVRYCKDGGFTYRLKADATPEQVLNRLTQSETNIKSLFTSTDNLNKEMTTLKNNLESLNVDEILAAIEGIEGLDTNTLNTLVSATLGSPSILATADTLTDGRAIVLEQTNTLMKNKHLTFSCDLDSLGSGIIRMGHGKTAYGSMYIEITSTQLKVFSYYTELSQVATYNHGLTVSGYVNVNIDVGLGTASIRLTTPSGTYQVKNCRWDGGRNGEIFSEVSGITVSDVKMRWFSDDYSQPIWLFGDSYFNLSSTSRWTSYLFADGYEDFLLAGYPGMGTTVALSEFKQALTHGTPEYVVWCMGMNDQDGAGTVSTSWLNATQEFLSICEEKGITPILSTIPTVPTRNNQPKNEWVRNSGYRYIDFEHAVVKDVSTGEWYPDMLYSDGVHPADRGAAALYSQVLVDFPEIMRQR